MPRATTFPFWAGPKEDKDRISEILQETWESADDWFSAD